MKSVDLTLKLLTRAFSTIVIVVSMGISLRNTEEIQVSNFVRKVNDPARIGKLLEVIQDEQLG